MCTSVKCKILFVRVIFMQKYKAKKVELDGYHFDSMAEAKHYWFGIKPRLEAGEIKDLRLQPLFRCEINGKLICKYLADFQYMDTKEIGPQGQLGCTVVEDVKGFKTPVYRIKKKLVEAIHLGTKIIEISPKLYQSKKYNLPSHAIVT